MSILLISSLIGLFLSLLFWQAYRLFNAVPNEDRSFLDRPAKGFRMVWPLILLFEYYFSDYFNENTVAGAHTRLVKGGMEFSISAQQFIASKLVSAVFFGLVALVLFVKLGSTVVLFALLFAVGGFFYPELWLKEATDARRGKILKSLPFYLDIITLSVEAGTNLTGGITQAVAKSGESPLRSELSRVLRDIRAGKARAEALRDMADRSGSSALRSVVGGMIQAEKSGSSLGPILRAQADQLRSERFQKAEKKAMEAPVKLLLPLVACIFPTAFLVLAFLVLSKVIMDTNIITWGPLVWAYSWPG